MGKSNTYINQFIDHIEKRRNYSTNTVDAYRRDLLDFNKFIGKEITSVTKEDIINYLNYETSKGRAVTTTNRKLATLKSFYKYLFSEGVTSFNPAEVLESGKQEKKLPSLININQFNNILDKVDNLRDKIIIELFLASGIRRGELASLKRSQVDLVENLLHVTGKGKKDRVIPLYKDILDKISIWLSQHNSEWVFPSPIKKGNHLSTRQINDIVQKWVKRAGFDNITPHSFRHSFGTYLYENGADIKSIQEMMGHESIDTTNLYSKTSIKRNKEEYLKYHPLNKRD